MFKKLLDYIKNLFATDANRRRRDETVREWLDRMSEDDLIGLLNSTGKAIKD
jgi:hypothetical protein